MKKNILFLLLSLLANVPLVAAAACSDDDYPYAGAETENTIINLYQTDTDEEGVGYAAGISTKNPKLLFEEAKMLIEASETSQSEATQYYLSQRFQDLQEKGGHYHSEILFRYIHAVNALRDDLHTKENIIRMVNIIKTNESFSKSQKKTASGIKKEMLKSPKNPKALQQIKPLIEMLHPEAFAPSVARDGASGGAAAAGGSTPTAERHITFNPAVEKVRYQSTQEELQSMHAELSPEKVARQITAGVVVREESSIAERMQPGSFATLNDIPASREADLGKK